MRVRVTNKDAASDTQGKCASFRNIRGVRVDRRQCVLLNKTLLRGRACHYVVQATCADGFPDYSSTSQTSVFQTTRQTSVFHAIFFCSKGMADSFCAVATAMVRGTQRPPQKRQCVGVCRRCAPDLCCSCASDEFSASSGAFSQGFCGGKCFPLAADSANGATVDAAAPACVAGMGGACGALAGLAGARGALASLGFARGALASLGGGALASIGGGALASLAGARGALASIGGGGGASASLGSGGGKQIVVPYQPPRPSPTLAEYYACQYPYDRVWRWLSAGAGKGEEAGFREFAFTFAGKKLKRKMFFKSAEEWRAAARRLGPVKMDAGAVFAQPSYDSAVKRRELVFDVDANDYDDVRLAAAGESGAVLSSRGWVFMAAAMYVLDSVLRGDFGFCDLTWVFSGRRGVHCWVADARAQKLDDAGRRAIASYVRVKAGETSWPLHPLVRQRYAALHQLFVRTFVESADAATSVLGADASKWGPVLKHVPSAGRARLETQWRKPGTTPLDRWAGILALNQEYIQGRIVLSFFWPRIDSNVTAQTKHLLKLPYCMHPDTLKICAPLGLLNRGASSCALSEKSEAASCASSEKSEAASCALSEKSEAASCASSTEDAACKRSTLEDSAALPIFLVRALSSASALEVC